MMLTTLLHCLLWSATSSFSSSSKSIGRGGAARCNRRSTATTSGRTRSWQAHGPDCGAEDTPPWTRLAETDAGAPARAPVLKRILEAGDDPDDVPPSGATVTIEYVGRLVADDAGGIPAWTADDVAECWLKEQQGLEEVLAGPFREHAVDGARLLDAATFTEEYLEQIAGTVLTNIQRKKTLMAARRLRQSLADFAHGAVFDSSAPRLPDGTYTFDLGEGKLIRGMELLVAGMSVGERALVRARSDFAYGADGYRSATGDVVVPPFWSLEFEVTLVGMSNWEI